MVEVVHNLSINTVGIYLETYTGIFEISESTKITFL